MPKAKKSSPAAISEQFNISNHYDAIVIGTGPGGEGAAMGLAKQGKSVAVIERAPQVGGGCTHWGTIPSKALRHSVSRIVEFRRSGYDVEGDFSKQFSFKSILKHTERVISDQVKLRQGFYMRNECPVYTGHAQFINTNVIEVSKVGGEKEYLSADQFVIATGSRPYRPADVDFNSPH
ncbi:MAG: FAD-dependent oxidoreductase, partial [Psychrobium sp.]